MIHDEPAWFKIYIYIIYDYVYIYIYICIMMYFYIYTYIYICRSCSNIAMVWRAAGAAQCDTCRWTYAGPAPSHQKSPISGPCGGQVKWVH